MIEVLKNEKQLNQIAKEHNILPSRAVKELKNIVYNTVLNAHSDFIQIDNLNLYGRKEKISNIEDIIEGLIEKNGIENIKDTLEEIEKIFYQKIINKSNNISKLSESLNISRVTFRNILKNMI